MSGDEQLVKVPKSVVDLLRKLKAGEVLLVSDDGTMYACMRYEEFEAMQQRKEQLDG